MIWIWISIWVLGLFASECLITTLLARHHNIKWLKYLHEEKDCILILFVCDLFWPIFWPIFIVVVCYVKLLEPFQNVNFNPIDFILKFATEKKYVREKVIEEI